MGSWCSASHRGLVLQAALGAFRRILSRARLRARLVAADEFALRRFHRGQLASGPVECAGQKLGFDDLL